MLEFLKDLGRAVCGILVLAVVIGGPSVGIAYAYHYNEIYGYLAIGMVSAIALYVLVSLTKTWVWPIGYLMYGVKGVVRPFDVFFSIFGGRDKHWPKHVQDVIDKHYLPASSGLLYETLEMLAVIAPVFKIVHFITAVVMDIIGLAIGAAGLLLMIILVGTTYFWLLLVATLTVGLLGEGPIIDTAGE